MRSPPLPPAPLAGFSPPPSRPPAFPPPVTFDVISVIEIAQSDLEKASPSTFAAAILPAITSQVAGVGEDTTVSVVVTEAQELTVDAGSYALYDASGNLDVAVASTFLAKTRAAACADLTGTCDVRFADTSLPRRRAAAADVSTPPTRRGLGIRAALRLTRSYHHLCLDSYRHLCLEFTTVLRRCCEDRGCAILFCLPSRRNRGVVARVLWFRRYSCPVCFGDLSLLSRAPRRFYTELCS